MKIRTNFLSMLDKQENFNKEDIIMLYIIVQLETQENLNENQSTPN